MPSLLEQSMTRACFHLKSLTIFQQLWTFLHIYKISWPFKSIPQKSNNDFKDKCPYTFEPMHIRHLDKKTCFAVHKRFTVRVRHIITKNLDKAVKTIIIVDTSLQSLRSSSIL